MPEIFLYGKNGDYIFDPSLPESVIGSGGTGVIYVGHQFTLKNNRRIKLNKVAIKVIYRELAEKDTFYERSRQEVEIGIKHPNLINMLDFIDQEGILHVISEFLEGETLDKLISIKDHLSEDEALEILKQILNGLESLHNHNPTILHRDIKPQNIFICNDGTVKLMDFGLAKVVNDKKRSIAGFGTYLGSPHYSPPEQVRGKRELINQSSDLYALGITFFEMLTGKPPFDAENEFDILEKQIKEKLPKNDLINPQFYSLIKKTTEKDQKDRYQSTALFIADVQRLENTIQTGKKDSSGDGIIPDSIIENTFGNDGLGKKSGSDNDFRWLGLIGFIVIILISFIIVVHYLDPLRYLSLPSAIQKNNIIKSDQKNSAVDSEKTSNNNIINDSSIVDPVMNGFPEGSNNVSSNEISPTNPGFSDKPNNSDKTNLIEFPKANSQKRNDNSSKVNTVVNESYAAFVSRSGVIGLSVESAQPSSNFQLTGPGEKMFFEVFRPIEIKNITVWANVEESSKRSNDFTIIIYNELLRNPVFTKKFKCFSTNLMTIGLNASLSEGRYYMTFESADKIKFSNVNNQGFHFKNECIEIKGSSIENLYLYFFNWEYRTINPKLDE